MNAFKKLAEANANHFDEHPVQHLTFVMVWSIGGSWLLQRMICKAMEREIQQRMNQVRKY